MFAYRLCKEIGQLDARAVLDSLTDEQLLEWRAIALIDGWHNGWAKTGEVLAAINNHTDRLIIHNMAVDDRKEAISKLTPKSGHDIAKSMMTFKKRSNKRKRSSTMIPAREAEARLRARYGN